MNWYALYTAGGTEETWYVLKAAEANFKLLQNDGEYLTLSEQEVLTLNLLDQDQDGLVDISTIFIDGDQVQVISGALMGQEARIVSVNKRKGRAKVKINFCGSERIIELGIELIEKLM